MLFVFLFTTERITMLVRFRAHYSTLRPLLGTKTVLATFAGASLRFPVCWERTGPRHTLSPEAGAVFSEALYHELLRSGTLVSFAFANAG